MCYELRIGLPHSQLTTPIPTPIPIPVSPVRGCLRTSTQGSPRKGSLEPTYYIRDVDRCPDSFQSQKSALILPLDLELCIPTHASVHVTLERVRPGRERDEVEDGEGEGLDAGDEARDCEGLVRVGKFGRGLEVGEGERKDEGLEDVEADEEFCDGDLEDGGVRAELGAHAGCEFEDCEDGDDGGDGADYGELWWVSLG